MGGELQLYRHRHMCLLLTDLRLRTSGLNRGCVCVRAWRGTSSWEVLVSGADKAALFWYKRLAPKSCSVFLLSSLLLSCLIILSVSEKCCILLAKDFYFCKNVWVILSAKFILTCATSKKNPVTLFIFGYTEPVVLHVQIPWSGSCMVWVLL